MAFTTTILKLKSIVLTTKSSKKSIEVIDPSEQRAQEFFDFYFKKHPEPCSDLHRDEHH